MARVYEVRYEGKSYWFTGDQCGDKDVAASKVPGCRPGYNCKVSARFTGDVPAEEYIAQQKATEGSATSTGWPTSTTPSLIEQRATGTTDTSRTTGGTTSTSGTGIPPGSGLAQGYNWEEWAEYERYLGVLNTTEGTILPIPQSISDYFNNKKHWERLGQLGQLPPTTRTVEDAGLIHGQLQVTGQVLAQGSPWLTPEGEPLDFDEGGEPIVVGDEKDKEPPPGFETYDEYLAYLKRQREYSEWSMQQAEYRAQEGYRETPQYGQVFDPWLEEQGQFSGALAAFTEKEYPSLVSKYKATQPRLTGYPTREEARAEAGRREAGFGGWLGGETPELEQKYWGQTPLMRGERPYMYQPTMRTVNW